MFILRFFSHKLSHTSVSTSQLQLNSTLQVNTPDVDHAIITDHVEPSTLHSAVLVLRYPAGQENPNHPGFDLASAVKCTCLQVGSKKGKENMKDVIADVDDLKEFKKVLRTRTNVLAMFAKSGKF